MAAQGSIDGIRDRLLERGLKIMNGPQGLVDFTGDKGADALLNDLDQHPHAFVFMSFMARNVKAEINLWAPFHLSERLGGFSFKRLQTLSLSDWQEVMAKPTPLHRFHEDMAKVLHLAVQRISRAYSGNAASIWAGTPSSAEVVFRFLQFYGVGPKIATLTANCLAREFKVPFSDYYSIDISADVHVRRVFVRLGLVSDDPSLEEVIYRARALHPDFPGLMDYPCWEMGRKWCKAKQSNCQECYMCDLCPTAKTK